MAVLYFSKIDKKAHHERKRLKHRAKKYSVIASLLLNAILIMYVIILSGGLGNGK